jgi:hypothetical protein
MHGTVVHHPGIEATGPVVLERIGCLRDVENESWFAKIPRQDNG